jgi:hypothetical protein
VRKVKDNRDDKTEFSSPHMQLGTYWTDMQPLNHFRDFFNIALLQRRKTCPWIVIGCSQPAILTNAAHRYTTGHVTAKLMLDVESNNSQLGSVSERV